MSDSPAGAGGVTAPTPRLATLFATRRRGLVQASFVTIYLVWGVSYAVGRIMASPSTSGRRQVRASPRAAGGRVCACDALRLVDRPPGPS